MASVFVYIMYLYNVVPQTNEIKRSRSVTEMLNLYRKYDMLSEQNTYHLQNHSDAVTYVCKPPIRSEYMYTYQYPHSKRT